MRFSIFYVFVVYSASCKITIPEDVVSELDKLPQKIDYNIHVKPILSDRCYHCHGPDVGTRAAEMRLDTRDGLFSNTPTNNKPFVSRNLNKSVAIKRILSKDHEFMMPPPDSKRNLSDREKAILVKWVEDGAEWKEHWAFIPPEKPEIPLIENSWKAGNVIDQFIYKKLAENNLEPSSESEKSILLRRVCLDLTGLPPTVQQLDNFLENHSDSSYEEIVDLLMSSKTYAERMALEWLDVARYADSHGFHADGERSMWPWRDWVINAFDANMPYDQFITEQLAGDLLENPDKDQIIATAFNRNHPMTAEGGVVDEEFRVEYVSNRTNTFGTALLGLTVECAKCHDHKFDPISQREYYQISAFFNNQNEIGMTGDDGNFGPMVLLSNIEQDEKIQFLNNEINQLEKQLLDEEALLDKEDVSVTKRRPFYSSNFDLQIDEDSIKYIHPDRKFEIHGEIEMVEGIHGKSVKFDHQDDKLQLNGQKQFEAYDQLSVSAWVFPEDTTKKTKVIIGNVGNKNELWRGWDFYLDSTNNLAFRLINTLPHNYLHVRSISPIRLNKWTHIVVTYDGSMKANGVNLYVNGSKSNLTIMYDRLYKSIIPVGGAHKIQDRGILLGKSRRSFTGDNGIYEGRIDELSIFDIEIPCYDIAGFYSRSKSGQNFVNTKTSPDYLTTISLLSDTRKKKLEMLNEIPELMVMEEMSEPRQTFVLKRGEYDKPMEKVKPGTITKVLPFSDTLATNRFGLSQWLFNKHNPLTARVVVNRYWQMIFGQGIVTSVSDFGNQGALPSHPDLLDWLAVDFMESGWDVKRLLKNMVMSKTYRQSSFISKEKFEADATNKWLARGPSYRWQAEMIRDNALAASGLLNKKVGGESVKPYQPDGLWIELGNFSYFLKTYKPDQDENQYRRSMYSFIRRTSPPPFMTLFDAPNREVCTVTRERTNTPLQALVLLNDPQFVEASRALANRMIQESGGSTRDQIVLGFKLALSRYPDEAEIDILVELYEKVINEFSSNSTKTEQFLQVGNFKTTEKIGSSRLAALSIVANTLLNMDEAYTKR